MTVKDKLNNLLAEYNHHKKSREEQEHWLSEVCERREAYQEAQKVFQEVASQVQRTVHDRVASLVTRCLRAVFDDPYEFKIHFESKRGKTEARMVFARGVGDAGVELDPTTAAGGGVLDVAAFALLVSRLLLSKRKSRRLLCLDEPFKMVSKDYTGRVKELLLKLSEELSIQIIMVTHNEDLRVGRVYEIGTRREVEQDSDN